MLFSSYIFLFAFLPCTLAGFCLLSRGLGPRPAKLWLTLASLVFYGWWNPIYVGLILASMFFNFGLGRAIGKAAKGPRVGTARPRSFIAHSTGSEPSPSRTWSWGNPWNPTTLLIFGVTANLLLLAYFKYANFFVVNVNAAFGTHWSLGKIVLPLGISFFTFTQIAYLVDASRGVVCEYDLGDFLLFITFFPHLIAGPIIHHREMMPQFAEPKTYKFDWNNLAVGLGIFAIGLFKKVVIADALSGNVAKVFGAAAHGAGLHRADAWAGVLCYTFQIYFDFSGYSDMAIALARMFGIVLPLNFDSPYKAVNIIDFWRRWHMTLSRFLRDYLYIPLGGNRRGPPRRYLNLILTMAIGGLWHGAAWTFVLWGLFHGVCLAANHLWHAWWPEPERRRILPSGITRWFARGLTFVLVVVGWVLFRASDPGAIQSLLTAMFGPAIHATVPVVLKPKIWFWLVALLAFVWLLPNTAELAAEHQPYRSIVERLQLRRGWLRPKLTATWAGLAALLLAAAVLSLSRAGEFLYYNF